MDKDTFLNGLFDVIDRNIPRPSISGNSSDASDAVSTTGLFLLPGATGSGKSHAVCKFIATHAGEWKSKKLKIIFTTRMIKNIPDTHRSKSRASESDAEDEEGFFETVLSRAYKDANFEPSYDEEVLFLRSMYEHLLDTWNRIEEEVTKGINAIADTYHDDDLAKYYKIFKIQTEQFIKNENKNNENDDFYKAQRVLVHKLKALLYKEVRNELPKPTKRADVKKKCEEKIFSEKSYWSWIPKLWPDHRVARSTVILLSLRKFTLPLVSVIGSPGALHNSLPDGSLVFIDEFDDAKTALLEFIEKDSLDHAVDLVELATTLGASISTKNMIASRFLEHSSGNAEDKKSWLKEKNEQYHDLQKFYKEIYDTYHLDASIKIDSSNIKSYRMFLCRTPQPYIITSDNTYLIRYSPDDGLNWIIKEENGVNSEIPVGDLINKLMIFVYKFMEFCNDLVRNKQYWLNNISTPTDSTMINWELNDFITTIINHYVPIGSKIANYLEYHIKNALFIAPGWKVHPSWYETNKFYTNGFSLFVFKDDPKHETRTAIEMKTLSSTPEAWLVSLAKRAFVVGLSATAYIDQPITNFDLGYLRLTLGDKFHAIKPEDMKLINDIYESTTKNYKNIVMLPEKPVLEMVDFEKVDIKKRWAQWLNENDNLSEAIFNEIWLIEKSDFMIQRYDYFFQVIKYFFESDTKALYIVTPFLLDENKKYTPTPVQQFFEAMAVKKENNDDGVKMYMINSQKYDQEINNIKDALSKGSRCLVFTSYQTIGRGVNLQYPFSDSESYIQVHEHLRKQEKEADIDGIYLAKPTNIIAQNWGDYRSPENEFHLIVQLHYLLASGYLNVKDFQELLYQGLAGKQKTNADLENDVIYSVMSAMTLQTLGRITRTGYRRKVISILCETGLPEALGKTKLPPEVVRIKEYEHLASSVKNSIQDNTDYKRAAQKIVNQTMYLHHELVKLMRNFKKESNRQTWQVIREQVAKCPMKTHTQEKAQENGYDGLYCEIPDGFNSYYYKTNDDFKTISISFERPREKGWVEVSESASGLQKVLSIPEVYDYFKNNNYALAWNDSRFFMNPVIYHNIYRAVLGEISIQAAFKQFGIHLKTMPDEYFEKFDFMIEDGIYVDAKYWSRGPDRNDEEEQQKIIDKLKECGGKRVYIINAFPVDVEPEKWRLESYPELYVIPALFFQNKIWDKAKIGILRSLA